jgi:tRNA-dihydrouridine synthase
MITVHGRTRQQLYAGEANWSRIAAVVEAVKLPVIANGDVEDEASAREAMAKSGAAGVMIGRGAMGRPWRPAQVAGALFGARYQEPAPELKLDSMLDQIAGSVELYGERLGARVVRKHVAAFVDAWCDDYGLPPLTQGRVALCRTEDPGSLARGLVDLLSGRRAAA